MLCVDFAAKKHKTQRRKDPEATPYINHPVGVAHSIANEGKVDDINVLKAALLHDTVEDTDTTIEEVAEVGIGLFGVDLCRYIDSDAMISVSLLPVNPSMYFSYCPRRNTIPTRTIIRGGWVSSSSSSLSSTLLKMG